MAVGTLVQPLDVVNQEVDRRVTCFFVSGNEDLKFALRTVNDGKDCELVTNAIIDRETKARYDLSVSVRYTNTRNKRQASEYMSRLLKMRERFEFLSSATC